MILGDSLARSVRRFTGIYASIALLVLLAGAFRETFPYLYFIAKPLVMISLSIFLFYRLQLSGGRMHYLLQGAILFSLMGDIFLMFEGDLYFQLGLGSFLVAQLFYIALFALTPKGEIRAVLRRRPWLLLPFMLYAYSLLYLLGPRLGELLVPVLIYALTLSTMAIMALNRWRRVREDSFAYVFAGALLFLISDSLIAINRFASDLLPLSFAHTWIMLTYIAAQYGLGIGMLIHLKS
ncbi:MAG: lysoplasmalogenase, partial [Bacteroidota bacterium]